MSEGGNNYEYYIDDPTEVDIPRTELWVRVTSKRKAEEESHEGEKKKKVYQTGELCHIDFKFIDKERVQKFYTTVFGWKITQYTDDYLSFQDKSENFGGGFVRAEKIENSSILPYIYTDDILGIKKEIESHGGKVTKQEKMEYGNILYFNDTEGNSMACWSR